MSIEDRYYVIPLSIQKDGSAYLVGNVEMGDFYQFPEAGVQILNMLGAGESPAAIKQRLVADSTEPVDIDGFLAQLAEIGFIHRPDRRELVLSQLQTMAADGRRTFNIDPRIARAVFSPPVLALSAAIIVYACVSAIINPALRINFNAFYTATNRTPLLLAVLMMSIVQVTLHETGHILAAARHGIRSKYGLGHRMWMIVAESDLTGILSLPRAQRYFPMLAGVLVDILCIALLTILLDFLLQAGAGPFAVQLCQAFVLEIVISLPWQLNIFVKTDIYFVICNYFGQADLDRDARIYLGNLLNVISFGMFGRRAPLHEHRNLSVLRLFAFIWIFGRILSILVLVGVFLPTMAQYLASAIGMFSGPQPSFWMACDTIMYVIITLTMLGTGMYMWFTQK